MKNEENEAKLLKISKVLFYFTFYRSFHYFIQIQIDLAEF